jgi:hypothetical protein
MTLTDGMTSKGLKYSMHYQFSMELPLFDRQPVAVMLPLSPNCLAIPDVFLRLGTAGTRPLRKILTNIAVCRRPRPDGLPRLFAIETKV